MLNLVWYSADVVIRSRKFAYLFAVTSRLVWPDYTFVCLIIDVSDTSLIYRLADFLRFFLFQSLKKLVFAMISKKWLKCIVDEERDDSDVKTQMWYWKIRFLFSFV